MGDISCFDIDCGIGQLTVVSKVFGWALVLFVVCLLWWAARDGV